jgi:ABC-type sulfate transport system permease component
LRHKGAPIACCSAAMSPAYGIPFVWWLARNGVPARRFVPRLAEIGGEDLVR